ncbi:ATP-dependent RNA helicase dhx37, partial [Coemansia spiralis]
MRSSKTLGRQSETRRENLQRAVLEEKLGVARSDPSVRLYVSERDPEEIRRQADMMARASTPADPAPTQPTPRSRGGKRGRNEGANPAAASSGDLEMAGPDGAPAADAGIVADTTAAAGSALAAVAITKRKRQKKGRVLEQLGLVKTRQQDSSSSSSTDSEFDSSASEDEDADGGGERHAAGPTNVAETAAPPPAVVAVVPSEPQTPRPPITPYTGSMLKPLLVSRGLVDADASGSGKRAFYVPVERPEHIQSQRMGLPVYAEEQQIMEAITENPVVVLSGETGSGKTTQVPQFL